MTARDPKVPCTACGTPTHRHETCAGCDAAALRARVVSALDAMPVGSSVRFRSGFVARAADGYSIGGSEPIVMGLAAEHCAKLIGPDGAGASTAFLAAVSS